MGAISLISAIVKGAFSQIAGGQSCQPRMTIEWHVMVTKSNLDALDSFHIYIRSYF
jgi:hypothetical protein